MANLSTPSNLPYWWVHLEYQDGGVNKAGFNTSKYRLKSHVYASLVAPRRKVYLLLLVAVQNNYCTNRNWAFPTIADCLL